mgnify:CR=1 FL=1
MIELFFASAAAVPSLGGPAEIWAAIVKDFSNIGSPSALSAFLQVLMIDIVLAGDNAIVVGALAAGGGGGLASRGGCRVGVGERSS